MRDALAAGFRVRDAYARARRRELRAALDHAAIRPDACVEIGCVDQEASLDLDGVARRVADLIASSSVDFVLTHPYEGGHPDHDATAFAVHTAAQLLSRYGASPPAIVEMTSYHAGPGGIQTGVFLPGTPEVCIRLSPEEQALKRAMLDCFISQAQMLAPFTVACERFRLAPSYRFDTPPHEGPLFYEHFDWGMEGPRWRRLAAQALSRLDLEPDRD